MNRQALTEQQIATHLETLDGWSLQNHAIEKEFVCENFSAAMGFLVRIALEAEKADHHPEMINVYNRVKIRLNTHSVKGITLLDFALAKKIDLLSRKLI